MELRSVANFDFCGDALVAIIKETDQYEFTLYVYDSRTLEHAEFVDFCLTFSDSEVEHITFIPTEELLLVNVFVYSLER